MAACVEAFWIFFVFLMVVLAEFGFPPSCQVAMSTLEHFNTSMVGFQRSCLPPYRCSSYHLNSGDLPCDQICSAFLKLSLSETSEGEQAT